MVKSLTNALFYCLYCSLSDLSHFFFFSDRILKIYKSFLLTTLNISFGIRILRVFQFLFQILYESFSLKSNTRL